MRGQCLHENINSCINKKPKRCIYFKLYHFFFNVNYIFLRLWRLSFLTLLFTYRWRCNLIFTFFFFCKSRMDSCFSIFRGVFTLKRKVFSPPTPKFAGRICRYFSGVRESTGNLHLFVSQDGRERDC